MARKTSTNYDALIGGIYDAAVDEALWPSTLEAAAAHFGASRATVYTPERLPQDGGFFFSHNIPSENIERYAVRFQHIDPWVHGHHSRFADQSGGFLGDMFVRTSELQKSEFYADHLRPLDIQQLCAAVTTSAPQAGDFISFAMFRGRRTPDFGEHERRLGERITPHIQRAFFISSRLRPLQSLSDRVEGDMLRVSRAPILLVDASGRIVQATEAATKLLDQGMWLQVRLGRLRAATGDSRLTRTISEVATSGLQGPFSRILGLVCRHTGNPLHVLVVRAGLLFPGKAFVVIGTAANRTQQLGCRLREVYGLTSAEIRLCERLGESRTIAEAAEMLAIQQSTVRSQLKSVFQKMGLKRQIDLTRAMIDLASL